MLVAACGGGDDSSLFPFWVQTDVVVADIDGDGRADVLTLAQLSTSMSQREGSLVVYRQTTAGVFAAPVTYVVGIYPWKLSVGDVNGDNRPDLVVTDVTGDTTWVMLGDAGNPGQFLSPQQIASGLRAYQAAIGDFNGDGMADIVLGEARLDANRLVVRYQDPVNPGTLLPAVDVGQPGAVAYVVAGELNGDGRTDLLMSLGLPRSGDTPNAALGVTFQQPDGALAPTTILAPQRGLNPYYLAIADFNGDGRNDLFAFFSPSSSSYTAKLTVLLQDPAPGAAGAFTAAPVDTSLAGIRGIDDAVVADLNGDGRPDVAVAGFFPPGESRLNLFMHSGGGAFTLAGVHAMPITVSRVAAGDIDGDGRNDLVVLGNDNQCLVLVQSHATPGSFESPRRLR